MSKIASIEIKNQSFYIAPVLDFLDSLASKHRNYEYARYSKLRFIAGGILEDRIKKAYPGKTGTIIVESDLSDTYFEVSIKDKGEPAWADFSSGKSLEEVHGIRNFLLNTWLDDVGIEKLGKDGQRIYMRLKILNPIQFQAPQPYLETKVLDTNLSIRPVQTEEDAIEAIRCIYSEYGYSYAYEQLYYVDSLLRMIKDGQLMSFLAVNDHGQTAGHFALAFSDTFKGMPEISTVVTRREFRGLGLFAKFMAHAMEIGRKEHFRALMGQPVAFHPMSQKAFLKSGFTATSVLLDYIGSDIESEYNKNHQRLDLFASVKILDESAFSKVYPPKELSPFVNRIYQNLGWRYEFGETRALSDQTIMSMESNSLLLSTKIIIQQAADDLEALVQQSVKSAIRSKNEMLEMFILMNNPSCEHAYQVAKKCGFAFSGLLPGSENGDYLVMQMLVGKDCRYDHLVTVGEFEELTKEIAALSSSQRR